MTTPLIEAPGQEGSWPGKRGGAPHGPVGALPRVVGLDLSLSSTGIAVHNEVIRIRSEGHRGDTVPARCYRLHRLRNQILAWCRGADLVVVEGPSYGSTTPGQHDRSGLWWMVVDRLIYNEIPVAIASPKQRAKYATGNGNATKDDVLVQVTRRFDRVYPLPEVMGTDEADAVVLYAMGRDHLGCPLVALPASHRSTLDKVEWPDGEV